MKKLTRNDENDYISHFYRRYAYGAADAAAIINMAKYYYLETENTENLGYFSKEHFLRALKKVHLLIPRFAETKRKPGGFFFFFFFICDTFKYHKNTFIAKRLKPLQLSCFLWHVLQYHIAIKS